MTAKERIEAAAEYLGPDFPTYALRGALIGAAITLFILVSVFIIEALL